MHFISYKICYLKKCGVLIFLYPQALIFLFIVKLSKLRLIHILKCLLFINKKCVYEALPSRNIQVLLKCVRLKSIILWLIKHLCVINAKTYTWFKKNNKV